MHFSWEGDRETGLYCWTSVYCGPPTVEVGELLFELGGGESCEGGEVGP